MSLAPGTRLGAYEIVGSIGAGGMGEVYRGRDTKLGRDVAIKVLPDHFANDAERVARFEREAKTLASLNHPLIAQIYGFEHANAAGAGHALIMELVDGEDLSQRIARGPIALDDAAAIAKQIADALDAAHSQGIIHRDLKPANVKIKPDGSIKVLDFGLAKAVDPPQASSPHALANSPTITSPAMTMHGVILGTAGYMAPEQAKGRPIDKRADIWAFGCIVYEMVTGQRAFAGEDVSETIASVLKTEPDLAAVPADVKPLLVACLQKDPRRRLRDIGDVGVLLQPSSASSSPNTARATSPIAWSIATVAAAAAIALGVMQFGAAPAPAPPIALDISAPAGTNFGDSYLAVSPDGRRVAYTLRNSAGVVQLWVRDVERHDARLLPGTEGARSPFWSPDSQSIAFVVDSKLLRADVIGGPPRLLSEFSNDIGVGSWGTNGVILIGSRPGGAIYRVPQTGGVATPVTTLDRSRAEGFHAFPVFLRDGKRFLYLRNSADPRLQGTFVGSIDRVPNDQPLDMLAPTRLGAAYYAPAGARSSWLVFIDNGNLMSQELDESRPALIGNPVPEAEHVGSAGSYAFFSVSPAGVLAYRSGESGGPNDINLTWFDRRGMRLPQALDRAAYASAKLSPDGTRIAGSRTITSQAADIWLNDLTRGIQTRLTSDASVDSSPIWSPDSSRVLFTSLRTSGPGLYEKRVDGADPERLVWPGRSVIPDGWSSDGRYVLFTERSKQSDSDLSLLELGPIPRATPLVNSQFDEGFGAFAPDGRHFAYVSDESGRDEVYVRTFTRPGATEAPGAGKWRVSSEGGQSPRWRRDGAELFYRDELRVMSVPIAASRQAFTPGKPVELFSVSGALVTQWDAAPDGQRFLMPLLPIGDASEPIRVILNWQPGSRRP